MDKKTGVPGNTKTSDELHLRTDASCDAAILAAFDHSQRVRSRLPEHFEQFERQRERILGTDLAPAAVEFAEERQVA